MLKKENAGSFMMEKMNLRLLHTRYLTMHSRLQTQVNILDHGIVRYASQLFSGMDNRMPQSKKWATDMVNRAFEGDTQMNKMANEFMKGNTNIDPKNIDVTELGAQQKLDIIYSGKDNFLYRKLVNNYIKILRDVDDEMIVDEESMAYSQEIENIITSAEKLFRFWTNKDGDIRSISPAILRSSPMISYFNKLVSNAILKELTRPVAKGAWHSIFAPFRPDLMKEYDLKPGEMLLADGKRQEKIKWNVDGKDETVTIEEALKRIKAEEDPMRQKNNGRRSDYDCTKDSDRFTFRCKTN